MEGSRGVHSLYVCVVNLRAHADRTLTTTSQICYCLCVGGVSNHLRPKAIWCVSVTHASYHATPRLSA